MFILGVKCVFFDRKIAVSDGNLPRVNLAITNNLGNVLSRGEAVSRVSDTNRTSPTTWVHSRSLSPEIIEKIQFPRHVVFLAPERARLELQP